MKSTLLGCLTGFILVASRVREPQHEVELHHFAAHNLHSVGKSEFAWTLAAAGFPDPSQGDRRLDNLKRSPEKQNISTGRPVKLFVPRTLLRFIERL